MARNIEIKARISNLEEWLPRAAALADSPPVTISQDDTFFLCPKGRLKLRAFRSGGGELIFYQREDCPEPKESHYFLAPVVEVGPLREALTQAYGVIGRVRKVRYLIMAGRTRIHLDRVEGLGDFLELEVVLQQNEPNVSGIQEARDLLKKLGISEKDLVERAYVDLLRDRDPNHVNV
jgi:predicted adenylyl cyclase CyaB